MQLKQLKMYCPDTNVSGIVPLPEGYEIKSMKPGEEAIWCYVCEGEFDLTDCTVESYYSKMNKDKVKPEDVLFIYHEGKPVGTSTALLESNGDAFLHYVAIRPEYRGKGLAYPLITAVLALHRERGRKDCYLTTDDWRLPAIKGYLRLGFLPFLWSEDARERWEKVGGLAGWKTIKALETDLSYADDIICK